jgi:sulfite reductase alpha subunit-like flavoprotein
MKKDFKYIEKVFQRRFEELTKKVQLKASDVYEWPHKSPLEDEFLISWRSEGLMKVMRLQEAESDETLQFDYAVGKSGIDYEYDDLLVVAMNSNEKVETIFEIYKLWFIENKSPAEMEEIMETYFKRFNPHYRIP